MSDSLNLQIYIFFYYLVFQQTFLRIIYVYHVEK